jgi:hypothetical protein
MRSPSSSKNGSAGTFRAGDLLEARQQVHFDWQPKGGPLMIAVAAVHIEAPPFGFHITPAP